jgi:lactobin A/cerein 7B family class IIb bacteriocin
MSQFKPVEETIEVPKETGKAGLLRVLEEIIDLKRVVEVRILASRPPVKVFYKRFVAEGEPERPLSIDLESLSPYAVLRNGEIQEIDGGAGPAAVVIARLFREVSLVGLWPIAFVGGRASRFWAWHKETMGALPSQTHEDAYGLPFLTDRQIDDDVLLLAASYDRAAAIIDAQRAFKLLLPSPLPSPAVETP